MMESLKARWQAIEAAHAEAQARDAEAQARRLIWTVPRVVIWRELQAYLRRSALWVLLLSATCGGLCYGTLAVIEKVQDRSLPTLLWVLLMLICTLAPWVQVMTYLVGMIRPRQSVDPIGFGRRDRRTKWGTVAWFDCEPMAGLPDVLTVRLLVAPLAEMESADATGQTDAAAGTLSRVHRLSLPRDLYEAELRPFLLEVAGLVERPIDMEALKKAHTIPRAVNWMLWAACLVWPLLAWQLGRGLVAGWSADGMMLLYIAVTMVAGPGTLTALVSHMLGLINRSQILSIVGLGNLIGVVITPMLWLCVFVTWQVYMMWPTL